MSTLSPPPTRSDEGGTIWKAWFTKIHTFVTTFQRQAGTPTTSDIPDGCWMVWKDTTGGTIKLYANDGGTIKSVTLT